MKKILLSIVLSAIAFTFNAAAQKSYMASSGESIFSYGSVETSTTDLTPVIRWSPVFNFGQHFHYDFSKHAGIYTGLNLRNVGLISKVKYQFTDANGINLSREIKIKERSYSLGLPLALKVGNVDGGTYFATGAEAEIMFAYKRKIKDNGNKYKYSNWFDDKINIFNPSVFAELHTTHGGYIKFKYYLMDFLNYQGIYDAGYEIPDYGPRSPLWYISIGTETFHKDLSKKTATDAATKSAYFKSKEKNSNDNFGIVSN
ncbi:MAG: hypothetical protein LH473_12355 [Chitinophagales bacterium]|nr:hypothetical protein [Chitinophagales bacterium]